MLRFTFRSIAVAKLRRLMPLLAAAAMVLSTATVQADLGDQLFKLLPDDGTESDNFGSFVAISGATAIVGVYSDDHNGFHSGSAYLFDTATGQQITKLLPDDGAVGDEFGVRVAISGNIAVVGLRVDVDGEDNPGFAYVFDTNTGQQIAKLVPDGVAPINYFSSVGISGTTAIVGVSADDENGSLSGSAYLFDMSDPATPAQVAKIFPGDGAAYDFFGFSVAISGSTAIVGAHGDDDNGGMSGSAYLFDITDVEKPVQIAKLLADDGAFSDEFGRSVAISGAAAIVGAHRHDHNGPVSGSAYLFDTATGVQFAELLAADGASSDRFGVSVGISGPVGDQVAIVGAWWDDDNGNGSGSAYLFDTTTGQQIAKLLPGDGAAGDWFGVSVAIGGTTAIAGAPYNDDHGSASGSAYLFCASSTCDDDNPCTDDSCDPDSGCIHTPNTELCDDGDACSQNDICSDGVCGGSQVTCDDDNDCTDDSCDPTSGCVFMPNSDSCDDGEACTDGDTCSEGTCGGSEVTCDDDNACTDDSCEPLVGCEFQDNFDAANECCDPATGNTTPIDDGDACTEDACDPSTGIVVHSPICLDIKPGSCPNPFNRASNGVLPVALIGSVNFDAQSVLLSSVQLSRADGIGGSVAPNEGPPGPHSVLEDVATPFDGGECGCHDLGSDGTTDLMIKFRTQDVVNALQLDEFVGGQSISLLLTGNLIDGTPINAQDCIWLVPPEDIEPANAAVESNEPGAFVEVTALDLNFDSDGFTSFARAYVPGTVVNLTAEPASPGGYPFLRWVIGGAPQPVGSVTIDVAITDDLTLLALYDLPCAGDLDGDHAVGASDLAQLLGSWGPCSPEGECPADFDEHGTVDAADLAFLLGSWGPCP